jgi:hypothetical protein
MAAFDPYYEWLGIPPKDQPPHHYRLLGVELYEDHLTAIDAAANRIMAYLQELSNGDNGALAQQLLNEVSAARVCLLNKKRKATYDQTLKTNLSNKKQKKKNKPAVTKTPPPLPMATPVETEEEAPFPAIGTTGIPQISTEDRHQGTTLGAASRRTTRRAKSGDKKILLVVIVLLLLVAAALGIMRFRPKPKATSKTEKVTNLKNVDKAGSLSLDDVIEEAQDLAFSLSQNEEVNYGKLIEIKEITALLIRPHWKQIAVVKPAKRKECYQLAIEHAEELFSNNHTLQHHKLEFRKKQAGSSKQPPQFDDRFSREAGKNYRKQYGTEFDTQLAQLLGNSK